MNDRTNPAGVKLVNGKSIKRDLLSLPVAGWRESADLWWDSLLIVPTRKAHDSGYAVIAIIGVQHVQIPDPIDDRGQYAQVILSYADDIQWPAQTGIPGHPDYGSLRTDAFYPSGVLHLWSSEHEFNAHGTSSTEIKIRPRRKEVA